MLNYEQELLRRIKMASSVPCMEWEECIFEPFFIKKDNDIFIKPSIFGKIKCAINNVNILSTCIHLGFCSSKTECLKLIKNGAIYVNDKKVEDKNMILKSGEGIFNDYFVIRKGKNKNHIPIMVIDQSSIKELEIYDGEKYLFIENDES
jgi:tyrosyl-tRNA synthetase